MGYERITTDIMVVKVKASDGNVYVTERCTDIHGKVGKVFAWNTAKRLINNYNNEHGTELTWEHKNVTFEIKRYYKRDLEI